MATDTLKVIIDSQAKGDGAAKAKRGLGGLEKAAKLAAGAFALMKAAQVAVDFVKFGANLQRQTASLEGLAQAAGTSGDAIVEAMQRSSDFTIDRMSAMQVSNRALMMDVAKTPAEFERLTAVARRLGQAMGMDATTSIDDFITAAGRQSMMIADNLGLTVRRNPGRGRQARAVERSSPGHESRPGRDSGWVPGRDDQRQRVCRRVAHGAGNSKEDHYACARG
jgi:hypothetical protein